MPIQLLDEKEQLNDCLPVTTPSKGKKKSKLLKVLLFTFLATSFTCLSVYFLPHSCHKSISEEEIPTIPSVSPLRPKNYDTESNKAHDIYYDPSFRSKSIQKLQGAVQIETESYDDSLDPSEDMTPWTKFFKLFRYLEETFPLLYQHLKFERVNEVGLLYTWEGSNPDLKPLLLMAHTDVVPVDPQTVDLWTHPPYSGFFDGEIIWGRGVSDCKNLLIGTLEAVEQLIKDGFKPQRTVILSFGHDEESTGYGAAHLSKHIEERYGADSLYAIIDEGTGVMEINGQYVAVPSTAEKGHLDIFIELTTPGGHSSVPPDHTSIGIISRLVALLEDNPFEPILSKDNPLTTFLKVAYGDFKNISKSLKDDILHSDTNKAANKRVVEFLVQDPSMRYSISTSQAIDIIHGGVKANALPEYVTLLVNNRISVDSNINETVERLLTHLKTVAKRFDLGITLDGETILESKKNGVFDITLRSGFEAAPITPTSGEVWDLFAGTVKHVFDDIVFKDTGDKLKVAPILAIGNTDTRSYWNLTKNIFRFEANLQTNDGMTSGIHSVDEHLTPEQHLQVITFLYEFIQNADSSN